MTEAYRGFIQALRLDPEDAHREHLAPVELMPLGLLVLVCVPWLPAVFSHDPVVRGLIASSLVIVAIAPLRRKSRREMPAVAPSRTVPLSSTSSGRIEKNGFGNVGGSATNDTHPIYQFLTRDSRRY